MNPSFLAPVVGNSVPDLGATTQVNSSGNVYLAPSSLGYQNISISVAGQSVFLPPIYSTVPGESCYTIKNSGGYPFGVRDSTGVLITAISPSGSATFALDNSGNWSFIGTGTQPGLVTVDTTAASTFSNTIAVPNVTFDSNTSVHFLNLAAGGFSAFVADNVAKTFSAPVTVSGTLGPPVAAFRVSATTLIVFYPQDSTNHLAVVLTLTGASPNYSISVGTPQTLTVGSGMTAWGGENSLSQPRIAQLSPTLYVASFVTGTNTSVAAISVSGVTVTIGAIANINTANAVADSTTCYPSSSTTALVIYNASAGTPNLFTVVISVAGTTCTVGAPASIPGTNNATYAAGSCQLSATKFLVLVNGATTSAIINAITVAGAVVTVGASFTLETGVSGFNNPVTTYGPGYSQGGATRFNPKLFPLSASTALIWYLDNAQISRCSVLTESSGTVIGGTILYGSVSSGLVTDSQSGLMLPQGTSEFIGIKQDGNSAGASYLHRLVANKISASTITVGQTTNLNTLSTQVPAQNHVAVRMTSGDYVLGLSPSPNGPAQNLSIFRSNGDVFTSRGNIDVPGLTGYTFGIAKPSANRLVLIGSTFYSGTPSVASVLSPRIFMVELAQ